MSDEAGPEQPAAERDQEDQQYRVDVTRARGVLVGDGSTQHNYFQFFAGTWTDGVAALVAASGQVDSPYGGLRRSGAGILACSCVSGVSGVGKTSLLRAGVLTELRRAGLHSEPEAAQWPCVVLVPGGSPLNELALAIAPATGADAAAVRQSLAANPADFALTARQAAQSDVSATSTADKRRVLLVVDQCETVFTQCDREEERAAFFTALCAAGSAGAAVVVIVIRADLEARLADYPGLADAVQGRYLLGGMTERQLRLAITEPAEAVNSAVDDDLVAELLREVRAHGDRPGGGSRLVGAGVLPLLSHALDQAWRGRPPPAGAGNAPLALADYERTGGIDRAVADSAQAAYALLTVAQQTAAQQVFTRLVATTTDGIDTAVRATRAGLLAGRAGSAAADVEAVLTAFAAKRLLTLAADSVEISHEVLLSAWPPAPRRLAGRHPRRPRRPGPAAGHRRRMARVRPRPVLPLQRQPARRRVGVGRPDRGRRTADVAEPGGTRIPRRQQARGRTGRAHSPGSGRRHGRAGGGPGRRARCRDHVRQRLPARARSGSAGRVNRQEERDVARAELGEQTSGRAARAKACRCRTLDPRDRSEGQRAGLGPVPKVAGGAVRAAEHCGRSADRGVPGPHRLRTCVGRPNRSPQPGRQDPRRHERGGGCLPRRTYGTSSPLRGPSEQ